LIYNTPTNKRTATVSTDISLLYFHCLQRFEKKRLTASQSTSRSQQTSSSIHPTAAHYPVCPRPQHRRPLPWLLQPLFRCVSHCIAVLQTSSS